MEGYQHSTSQFNSSKDDFPLFYQQWTPNTSAERVIVFQHGLGEHSGRYQNLVQAFSGTATAFYGMDARGHGRTDGKRGHVDRFQLFVSDLCDLIKRVRQENDGQKVFLLGHSMGGAIVLKYAITGNYQDNLRGLIASSPAIRPTMDWVKKLQKPVAALLARLTPSLTLSNQLNINDLSHHKPVVMSYHNDPLVHGRTSACLGHALFNIHRDILSRADSLHIPVYLMHGTADRLTSADATQHFYNLLTTPDKTLKLYEGLYHETMNERPEDRARVLDDLKNWVLSH
ncbi:alpha/beta hydrolase [Tunicatimonas pelagia]|uniref:alpha/beta hydrolase n=1 Tax=Tunicatimonas pelagia TaxID=931531 RepID=UPI0026654920|nr:alpha/beta hydrolase [Tunicatimonas pelagia]WKN45582.1 lysophospholipase [Tunicatimonas pelagia]